MHKQINIVIRKFIALFCLVNLSLLTPCPAGTINDARTISIANGWAKNSVNAVIFRRNSIVTHENTQYAAFYDEDANVVLAKRALGTGQWEVHKTQYKGNAGDAHNSISIMADGDGFLHMSWDHHVHPLRYCRSKSPGSLELTDKLPMTGHKESRVTYPEFYRLPNGDLLFLYRDGASGRGNVMLNQYDVKTRTWSQLQDGFINGQGERNAYWQMTIDIRGTIRKEKWRFKDLTPYSVGMWEPGYDTELWKQSKVLHIFVQKVGQRNRDEPENIAPQPVSILEWKPD